MERFMKSNLDIAMFGHKRIPSRKPTTAKADRAENRLRRYEDKPAYRLLLQSVYRLVVVQ